MQPSKDDWVRGSDSSTKESRGVETFSWHMYVKAFDYRVITSGATVPSSITVQFLQMGKDLEIIYFCYHVLDVQEF